MTSIDRHMPDSRGAGSPPPEDGATGTAEEPAPGVCRHEYRSFDTLRVSWRSYGQPTAPGVPLLCLCGLTRNGDDFHAMATHFSGSRRVLVPDYRGRGDSAPAPDPAGYTPAVYLEDIRHLLAIAGVERVIVVGTSLGGLLAMGLAVQAPARLAGVVLNDIGPEVSGTALRSLLDTLEERYSFPDHASALAALKAANPFLVDLDDRGWQAMVERTYHLDSHGRVSMRCDSAVLRQARKGSRSGLDLWTSFRALAPLPVLVLRGVFSDLLMPACVARMAREHPDLVVSEIAARGHVPFLDEAESLAALEAFFARVDSQAWTDDDCREGTDGDRHAGPGNQRGQYRTGV